MPAALRTLVAVMAGFVAAGAGPALAQDPPPAVGPQHYTLGTFNMAGGNARFGESDATADALIRSIAQRGADVVFLQEACRDMTNRMQRALLPRGWAVRFLPTTSRCIRGGRRSGSDYGIGIVHRSSRFRLRGQFARNLPSRGVEQRAIVCLDAANPRPILACSTHLTAGSGRDNDRSRRRQTDEIARIVAPAVSAGRTVFVGGDLNATPHADALDPLWHRRYGGGAFGPFVEVDSGPSQELRGYQRGAGEDTTQGGALVIDHKIDYIFVRGVAVARGEVGSSRFSDHAPLWATVVQ